MKEKLLATLKNSKNYTLDVADKMPDSSYHFKPNESVWNFNELMQHIAYGIDWWKENYINGKETAWQPPVAKGEKKEAIAKLEKAYGSLQKTISNIQLTDQAIYGFHATLDHITHHRGQAIMY